MKDLSKNMISVCKRLEKSGGCVLMLDFDGTLAPIVNNPNKVLLPLDVKYFLKSLNKFLPVVVISGRNLKDLKKKVAIKDLIYAGNQGLEWQMGKRSAAFFINKKIKKEIEIAKKEFEKITLNYKGALIEDKDLTFSVHYRLLNPKLVRRFLRKIKKTSEEFKKRRLISFLEGKKVLDVKPNVKWNKGYFADFMLFHLQKNKKRALAVYIGDDKTDEDIFKRFKNGITIRVGYKKDSAANYFIKNQREVAVFLSTLLFLSYNKGSN